MKIEKMIPWPSENAGSMVQLAHWSSAEEHVNIWELENCGHLSEDNIGWCMICMWERTGIRMGRMGRMAQNGNAEGCSEWWREGLEGLHLQLRQQRSHFERCLESPWDQCGRSFFHQGQGISHWRERIGPQVTAGAISPGWICEEPLGSESGCPIAMKPMGTCGSERG